MKKPTHPSATPGVAVAAVWCGVVLAAMLVCAQTDASREYVDAQGRFRFTYPASFGAASPGTNDGFGDRVAAVRFALFSSSAIGGEAALTRGFPVIDLQAVGGLYDAIVLELFPDPIRAAITGTLPRLTSANFCAALAQERHLDPELPAFTSLSPQQRAAIAGSDRMRNVGPRVVRCTVEGSVVTFDKDVAFQEGGPRQRVYGAVRFLEGAYSTFQIVRAGAPADPGLLDQMTAVVRSWASS